MKVLSSAARAVCRILPVAAVCLAPHTLLAQGCALCYTQAANSPQRFIQALRSGILVLMLPPMALSVIFAVMAYRRRNSFHDELVSDSQSSEL